jgi:predicted nucleotidyltransferase
MDGMNTEDLLKKLRRLKPEMKRRYKAKGIGLFGSFVRQQQSESSDIDILVEFEEGADLLDLMELTLRLEEELQRKVDVVSRNALRPELREAVLREVVAL